MKVYKVNMAYLGKVTNIDILARTDLYLL